MEIDMGQPIILKCSSTGYPPALIEWRAPNDDIYTSTNDDFDGVRAHFDGTLIITDGAEKIDDGQYACIGKYFLLFWKLINEDDFNFHAVGKNSAT